MIVLDANILIRAVLGRRVRKLLEEYSTQGIRFYAPDVAYTDAALYLPFLLERRGQPEIQVAPALDYLRIFAETITAESYGLFEDEARQRMRGRDEEDWPVLASSLALACPIWTEDQDFFGTGIATWTTSHIEFFLEAQVKALRSDEE